MSSKPRASFALESKPNEHASIVGKHEPPKKTSSSINLSPLSSPLLKSKRRPPLSKLASLPFRYAFDGFSNRSSNLLTKQNTIPSPTNTDKSFANERINTQQNFSSSSLSGNGCGRYNSSHNGDCSTSEVEISEENLHQRKTTKQSSISSSDLDDFKSSSISNGTNQQVWESKHNLEEEIILDSLDDNSNNTSNNQTLPTRLPESDLLAANLKKISIRRHHSAPQSDAKWLQV